MFKWFRRRRRLYSLSAQSKIACHMNFPLLTSRRTVLAVSPYAVFPPTHGGARRMYELYRRLSRDWNLLVLSDEGHLYGQLDGEWLEHPRALYSVKDRDQAESQPGDRIGRIESHSRKDLASALEQILDAYPVDVVLIEYIELAGLIRQGKGATPWVLDLHDVLTDGENPQADDFENSLIERFDRVIAASPEDQSLLKCFSCLIENGVDTAALRCDASPSNFRILFPGPFRYAPNLQGAREFAKEVFPALREHLPQVSLRILAGANGEGWQEREPAFRQPGVEFVLEHKDMREELSACSLTINPVGEVRGSALKVVESVAAGRVCVATVEGSRGFAHLGIESLVQTEDVASMIGPIAELLQDSDRRQQVESAGRVQVHHLDWDHLAHRLGGLLRELME